MSQRPTDRVGALERLQRLRGSGAVSEAEFLAEKQRILAGEGAAFDIGAESGGRRFAIIAGLAIVTVALAGGLWFAFSPNRGDEPEPASRAPLAAAPQEVVSPAPSSQVSLAALPASEQLSRASVAVLGTPGDKVRGSAGEETRTRAVRLLRLPFGPVLLTTTETKDGCHACDGFIGVHHLAEEGAGFRVLRSFPEAVSGWGWGMPPGEWEVSDRFTQHAAIVASGGYTGQGYTCESMTITELGPDGPVTSDMVNTGYSNAGAVSEETGETMGGEPLRELEGRIAEVVRGRSFEVRVDGAETFVERYGMQGGKFVRTSGETQLGC